MRTVTAATAARRLMKLEARRVANQYRERPPAREPTPITLPRVSTGTVTDADIGLTPHDGLQQKAEEYIRIAAAARLRAELQAEAAEQVNDPADHAAHIVDRGILVELVRITARRA